MEWGEGFAVSHSQIIPGPLPIDRWSKRASPIIDPRGIASHTFTSIERHIESSVRGSSSHQAARIETDGPCINAGGAISSLNPE